MKSRFLIPASAVMGGGVFVVRISRVPDGFKEIDKADRDFWVFKGVMNLHSLPSRVKNLMRNDS